MLTQSFEAVDTTLLKMVCDDAWPESSTLEFKRDAPGKADKDKLELLKDICALANSEGGDLVFGIDEVNGVAASLVPITNEPAEALTRRIIQTVESGIEPRLLGMQTKQFDIDGGYVLVLRVLPSFLGPHSFWVNSSRRFVMRTGITTIDLTFDQLRMAFDRTASLGERARTFITERNQALINNEMPKRLTPGPILAVHFVPLSGLAGKQAPDLQALYNKDYIRLVPSDWGTGNRVFNLDGLVVFPYGNPEEGHSGYTQLFRNGAMEAAALGGGSVQPNMTIPAKRFVYSIEMTKFFREHTQTFFSLSHDHGLAGPAVVSFSVLRVKGYELESHSVFPYRNASTSDRSNLIAPEVWVDNLESAAVDDVVHSLLDTLWQGFGHARCPDYDAISGEYKPRQY